MAEEFHVFADDLARGGDVVIGVREAAARVAATAQPVRHALDLGYGAGAIALCWRTTLLRWPATAARGRSRWRVSTSHSTVWPTSMCAKAPPLQRHGRRLITGGDDASDDRA